MVEQRITISLLNRSKTDNLETKSNKDYFEKGKAITGVIHPSYYSGLVEKTTVVLKEFIKL